MLKLRTATGIKYSPTFDYELPYSIKNLRKRLFGLKFDFVNFEKKKQRVFPQVSLEKSGKLDKLT